MRIMSIITGLALTLSATHAFAAPATSPVNEMIQYYSPPEQFQLFSQTGDKQLTYNSAKTLRICARENRHMTGLKVSHDGNNSVVKPGECGTYTASNFDISPNGVVDPNYGLEGTVGEQKS